MIRPIHFLLAALVCCFVISCDKSDEEKDDPADALVGTRWQATLTDESPETNPSGGGNLYYPWQDCHLDDTFTFGNDRLTIDDNGTACGDEMDSIFEGTSQSYTYDPAAKTLTVGTGEDSITLQVYELNDARLKIGLPVPGVGGHGNLIFLFKKK